MATKRTYLFTFTIAIVCFYFLFLGLVKAKGFFAPLIMAVILSLIVLPLAQKMEKIMKRSMAALLNSLMLFIISIGLMAVISFQLRSLAQDWPKIKDTMAPKIEQLKSFALEHTPLSKKDIKTTGDGSQIPSGTPPGKVTDFMKSLTSFMANYLLTFVYIFFLLNYRRIFKNFLLDVFPDRKRRNIHRIINDSLKIAPQYLIGKLMLMGLLIILYAIGLGVSGVSNFILVSVIAGVLTLIPYIGNIIAFFMAVLLGYLTTGDIMTLVGIALTFTIAQFVESYALEPYVVGDRVDVHPFFVILVVILGNLVWGVIGMILAIPVMGILTVILLHIEELKSFGILFSKKSFSEKSS